LGGTVESVNYPTIKLKAGQVVTENGQNNLIYKTYTATVTQATQYKRVDQTGTQTEIDFSQIAAGDNITVYTSENPYAGDAVTVSQVEIRD
jgi:hypothetical protein